MVQRPEGEVEFFSKASSVTSCDHAFIIIEPQVLEASNQFSSQIAVPTCCDPLIIIIKPKVPEASKSCKSPRSFSFLRPQAGLKPASRWPQHGVKRPYEDLKNLGNPLEISHSEALATRPQEASRWPQHGLKCAYLL